jgi:hypothetical protein
MAIARITMANNQIQSDRPPCEYHTRPIHEAQAIFVPQLPDKEVLRFCRQNPFAAPLDWRRPHWSLPGHYTKMPQRCRFARPFAINRCERRMHVLAFDATEGNLASPYTKGSACG